LSFVPSGDSGDSFNPTRVRLKLDAVAISRGDHWLQPHEGSSETVELDGDVFDEIELQPHEGSSETPPFGLDG